MVILYMNMISSSNMSNIHHSQELMHGFIPVIIERQRKPTVHDFCLLYQAGCGQSIWDSQSCCLNCSNVNVSLFSPSLHPLLACCLLYPYA